MRNRRRARPMQRNMKRLIALLCTLLTGCSWFAPRHRTLGVTADLTTVAGFVVFTQQRECDIGAAYPQTYPECLAYNDRLFAAGALVIALGATLGAFAIGWTIHDNRTDPGPMEPEKTIIARGPTREAPQHLRTDDAELTRLGQQAWNLAAHGHCRPCRDTLAKIADRAYRERLALDATIAACL